MISRYGYIDGDSMQGIGIFSGDLAVIDRSVEPIHGHVVVALLNKDIILKSENSKYPDRHVMEGDDLSIWGVVTHSVRSQGR